MEFFYGLDLYMSWRRICMRSLGFASGGEREEEMFQSNGLEFPNQESSWGFDWLE